MADTSHRSPSESAEPEQARRLEDIEQDLDRVDAALDALDSGDLEEAESLAADLGPRPSAGESLR